MSPSRSTEKQKRNGTLTPWVAVGALLLGFACDTGGGAAAESGARDLSVVDAAADAVLPLQDVPPPEPTPDAAPAAVPEPDAALPDAAPDAAPPLPDAAPVPPDAAPDPAVMHETFALEGATTCLKATGDGLSLTFQLVDGPSAILPYDQLASTPEPVEALAVADAFGLGAPDDVSLPDGTNARFTPEDGAEPVDVPLSPTAVTFDWKGGAQHRHEERLLILMVDQSASMGGIGPDGSISVVAASDPLDHRLDLLKNVVEALPLDWWLSLVSFSGRFATLSVEFATPTLNRQAITHPGSIAADEDGLGRLQLGESGGTPLADALSDVLTRIIDARSNSNLNAQILLVTDGVEEGDTSTHRLDQVVALYANHQRDGRPAPVPVTVVHVARSPEVPDGGRRLGALADLACRTGGDYLFMPGYRDLGALAEAPRAQRLSTGLVGMWRLETQGVLEGVPVGAHLVSTRLRATLAGLPQSFDFEAPADPAAVDTRGFFVKP